MEAETLQPTDTVNDAIRLDLNFDAEKLKAEIEAQRLRDFNYYDVLPLRAPAHIVDPTLPEPPPADDYADGSWTDWKNTEALESSPYLKSIVEMFQEHTKVTLVRVLRLDEGEVVKEHTDPTLGLQVHKSVIRLTVPVVSDERVEFYLNNKIVPMKPGECWYMRLSDPHKIINKSSIERINLSFDMIPNKWVREKILAFDGAE